MAGISRRAIRTAVRCSRSCRLDQPNFRRPRSTAIPPSRSVKPLAANAGSISGTRAAGDVQTPGVVLLPVDPQLKDCGGPEEKKAVQLVDIVAESPPTPRKSTLVAVSV